ncbi:hypothetical protein VaNZ11_005339, partial [Volvox africanus]
MQRRRYRFGITCHSLAAHWIRTTQNLPGPVDSHKDIAFVPRSGCCGRGDGGDVNGGVLATVSSQRRFSTMLGCFSTAGAGNAAPAGASVSDSTVQASTKSTTSTSALPQTEPCGSEPQLQPSEGQAILLGLAPTARPPPSAAELLAPMLEGKPFTVAKIPGRGRGLVASRVIPRGDVVQREAPLLAFPGLGGAHAVCYHCLSPLALSSFPVRHPGPNGRRLCCDACMEAALEQYLAVEEATAAAAAAAATTTASSRSNSSSD